MGAASTIFELLSAGDDGHVAVSGLDRPDLDYRGLRDLVRHRYGRDQSEFLDFS